MPRTLLARSSDRQTELLRPTQHAVPRLWLERPRPAQQQLAQLMARLLLRMREPRVAPLKGAPDAGHNA
jgi:hypothetical protein